MIDVAEVRRLQARLGVAADGVMGSRTWAALWRTLGDAPNLAAEGAGAPPTPVPVPRGLRDATAFYQAIRSSFGRMTQGRVDGTNALLDAIAAAGWPVSWAAYALATAWHETDRTMQPILEKGGTAYFHRMYDIAGARPAKARELGNLAPGDGARYAGRGYVQLTGKANYAKATEKLRPLAVRPFDLVRDPDLAMDPEVAARVTVLGMAEGWFTGKRLAHYLPPAGPARREQFREARRIINGTDKADKIAGEAMAFQSALSAGGWQ